MFISWLKFHLPQSTVLRRRGYSSILEVESHFAGSCALGSLLCTLLKCGRVLVNEELSCWRELFQRLHLSPSVYRGAGDKEKAVAGRLFITSLLLSREIC